MKNLFVTLKSFLFKKNLSLLSVIRVIGASEHWWLDTIVCLFWEEISGYSSTQNLLRRSIQDEYNYCVSVPMIKEVSLENSCSASVTTHSYWFLNINILPVTGRTCLAIHVSKKRKRTICTSDWRYINRRAFGSGRTSDTRLLSCLILVCAIATSYTNIHFISRTIKSLLASNTWQPVIGRVISFQARG